MSLTNEQLLDAIRELQTQMSGMKSELREEISGVRSELQSFRIAVNGRFDTVEKKQDAMHKQLVDVSEDVTTIKGTIDHHESDIKSLYKRSFDLKEKVDTRMDR
ncbi:hypothetical protein EPH95_05775 [Salicibibacter halophilus]|uniref:Uncharacterized protein n=1 Tax=Salicibibacter halophilus TaxID=2502791 RepID=A0A514LFW6_9BACI|nr:hypothetical protein [Salicibibacter halophilus]QDI90746.1 hypothetical protein EPH95_05775 [Salicibibacter halophilus]